MKKFRQRFQNSHFPKKLFLRSAKIELNSQTFFDPIKIWSSVPSALLRLLSGNFRNSLTRMQSATKLKKLGPTKRNYVDDCTFDSIF